MAVREKQPRRAGSWPARPVLWSRPGSHPRERRAFMPAAMEGTGETDSVPEERGFEPPVPLANEKVVRDRAEGGSTTRIPSTAAATKRLRSGSYGCDAGRVAARGRAHGNIASDHAARADHGIISDGHARQNDRAAADPHVLTDPDGASELGARLADRRVARMVCGVD